MIHKYNLRFTLGTSFPLPTILTFSHRSTKRACSLPYPGNAQTANSTQVVRLDDTNLASQMKKFPLDIDSHLHPFCSCHLLTPSRLLPAVS
jgi:hypothetical protein